MTKTDVVALVACMMVTAAGCSEDDDTSGGTTSSGTGGSGGTGTGGTGTAGTGNGGTGTGGTSTGGTGGTGTGGSVSALCPTPLPSSWIFCDDFESSDPVADRYFEFGEDDGDFQRMTTEAHSGGHAMEV
ncbi:MAG: hypothetical protein JRI68_14095, partial [Deltaproteobacteria bacterium]|nr:hypothetical protein [Deltaproteobacteria bacterium]